MVLKFGYLLLTGATDGMNRPQVAAPLTAGGSAFPLHFSLLGYSLRRGLGYHSPALLVHDSSCPLRKRLHSPTPQVAQLYKTNKIAVGMVRLSSEPSDLQLYLTQCTHSIGAVLTPPLSSRLVILTGTDIPTVSSE